MPRPLPLAIALLTACGPTPAGPGSTSELPTSDITTTAPATTTADPTTGPTATPADTTTTAGPTTTDSTTTESQDFVPRPDTGNLPFQCDVFKQDCPPGQKCTAHGAGDSPSWNATKCVDVTGDGAPGDPCTVSEPGNSGIDDCAFGAMCWNIDETLHGTCLALCSGTPDAPQCPEDSHCAYSEPLNLCIPECDPLLQDCPGGDLCIPLGEFFSCVIDLSGDEGQANDPCEFANVCDQGLVCLDTTNASSACDPKVLGCCQPFCKFPNSPCPNPDQECLQWYDPMQPIPPGHESLGVCAIPE